jgi:hypothetical protein
MFENYVVQGGMAGLVQVPNRESNPMQCFPLYSLLLAAGKNVVFSSSFTNIFLSRKLSVSYRDFFYFELFGFCAVI